MGITIGVNLSAKSRDCRDVPWHVWELEQFEDKLASVPLIFTQSTLTLAGIFPEP
ncbi:MAG: hypothetical protein RIM23_18110 [Coleofasciculus sp. G3-WIS-01]|uniref:hypothetical protein n=1 Tax=Coleofasciculus sp. G3-WIS-01 TaxID=3069528 RepID=UPI0032FD5C77